MLSVEPTEITRQQVSTRTDKEHFVAIRLSSKPGTNGDTVLAQHGAMLAERVDTPSSSGHIGTEASGTITVFVCPATTQTQKWRDWLSEGEIACGIPQTALVPGGRIALLGQRAVFCGTSDNLDYSLKILAQFSLLEQELKRLERCTAEALNLAEQDVELTHQVSSKDFSRWSSVNSMTEAIGKERIAFTKLEGAIMHLGIATLDDGKTLYQLTKASEFEDRMEHIDDVIEVVTDIYELCNDRISEFAYFDKEYKCELWIILILILEVLLLVVDIAIHYD